MSRYRGMVAKFLDHNNRELFGTFLSRRGTTAT